MFRDHSSAVLETVSEGYVYPVVIVALLLGTAAALAANRDWLGVAGVIALSVVSVTYGAMQRPEEFRE